MRVLVFGTFDRLHPGHRFVLAEAAKQGDLFVVIARDTTVKRLKGRLPLQSEGERAHAIAEVVPGAHVVLGHPDDFLSPVREIRPDLILLGYDQRLPPGIELTDLPCPAERLGAYQPEHFKSSRLRVD
ncbi:MAG: adenylyltransferase/cytidyltransferase family protein [Candidatus Peribacteraceae bacterium]|nr:adenylyltransferase/cytidyltransferase family protein [Candidatus Peribacteraceae bacterium]